jgi:hypothetical protein
MEERNEGKNVQSASEQTTISPLAKPTPWVSAFFFPFPWF